MNSEGKAVIITELDRFGSMKTWINIKNFFKLHFDSEIIFERIELFADANKVWEPALRIIISGGKNEPVLEQFLQLAQLTFGMPQKGKIIWQAPSKNAEICSVHYNQSLEIPRLVS